MFLLPLSVIRLPELVAPFPHLPALGQVFDATWMQFLLPALGFVMLYSFLGHKEVRFLFPALPLFNISAAAGLARLYRASSPPKAKRSTVVAKLLLLGGILCLLTSFAASVAFVAISRWNYPGGQALQMLEKHLQSHQKARIFIDVGAAMTGVSLFGQRQIQRKVPDANFVKAGYEDEHQTGSSFGSFTHLLMEQPIVDGFHIIGVGKGNPKYVLHEFRISTQDVIYVHENDRWPNNIGL